MVMNKGQPRVASAVIAITLTTGDGSSAVVLERQMRDANYIVLCSVEEDLTAGSLHFFITAKTATGFTINLVSDSAAGTANVRWTAIPQVME